MIVEIFEQEQRQFVDQCDHFVVSRDAGVTTMGFWMSSNKFCVDKESQLPMPSPCQQVYFHHLAQTNEAGGTNCFLLHQAWSLSRDL